MTSLKTAAMETSLQAFPSFLPHPLPSLLLAPFDSRSSFFAPKPHGNACYAGYFQEFMQEEISRLDLLGEKTGWRVKLMFIQSNYSIKNLLY